MGQITILNGISDSFSYTLQTLLTLSEEITRLHSQRETLSTELDWQWKLDIAFRRELALNLPKQK